MIVRNWCKSLQKCPRFADLPQRNTLGLFRLSHFHSSPLLLGTGGMSLASYLPLLPPIRSFSTRISYSVSIPHPLEDGRKHGNSRLRQRRWPANRYLLQSKIWGMIDHPIALTANHTKKIDILNLLCSSSLNFGFHFIFSFGSFLVQFLLTFEF